VDELENHPASMLFPMMGTEDLKELAVDIKANGQVDAIMLYQGKILDGRNRFAACRLAGVQPRVEELNEELSSPILYVLSKNLRRRHLTVEQRAVIAAESIPLLSEEGRLRQRRNLKNQKDATLGSTDPNVHGRSTVIAAGAADVSPSSVKRVLAVKRADADLYEQITGGAVTISAAYNQIKGSLPRPRREAQITGAQKRRMISGISLISVASDELLSIRHSEAASCCDEAELRTWIEKLSESTRKLVSFRWKLQEDLKQGNFRNSPTSSATEPGSDAGMVVNNG
jgi:hypothetical protein